MPIPVLIAARNEAPHISETLSHLDADTVTPYVVVNDSSDNTAEIARRYTDNVYEIDEAGKMVAIQHGLKVLGEQALGPVLYTDADTRPVFPKSWAASMVRGLGEEQVGIGLLTASDGTLVNRTLTSALRLACSLEKYARGKTHIAGANMITQIGNETALERVLSLDNFGQGEDGLRSRAILQGGRPKTILNVGAVVMTSSRYKPKPLQAIVRGRKWAHEAARRNRIERQAPGVKAY